MQELTVIEKAFFAVAILLPLVGGGLLLYFLSRRGPEDDSKKDGR